MNIVKTHHDCYESPNPEVDFDQINDKYLQSEVIKNESQQVYTIYKVKPEKSEGLVETNEERLNRLKAELFELKEEVEFLADKEKLFNGSSDEEELNLLKEIKKLQDEMMEIAKSNGIDSILSNAFQNQANFEQNMKFLDQQNQKKHLENIFSKIDSFGEIFHSNETLQQGVENIKVEVLLPQKEEDIMNLKKFKELETRLEAMERLVGIGKDLKIEGSIAQKIDDLHNLASSLNPQRLEINAKKIQVINSELEQIMRKNNELVYSDNDFKKIQDLYEKFLKTQKIASEIPEILEKLECLKYMHENSGKTGHDLINLKNNEKVISEKLQENKILLEKVEKLFLTNLKGFFEKIRDVEEKTNVLLNK